MAEHTSDDAKVYGWVKEYASRGLRTGKLSKKDTRALCGAVLELLKRIKVEPGS